MKAHSTTDWLVLIAILIWSAFFQVASAQVASVQSGEVEFTSSVPLHTFSGISDEVVGRIDFGTGEVDFYIDLTTLKTGIGKRDKDMRTTLAVDTYPFAEFFGALVSPPDLSSDEVQAVSVKGVFGLHGVSREIEVEGTLQRQDGFWLLEAKWSLLLGDYDIEPPKLLIMKVDERQEIRLSARLKPE